MSARRTPEEWAAKTIHYGKPCEGPEGMGRELGLCAFCRALAADFEECAKTASARWRAIAVGMVVGQALVMLWMLR